MAPRVSPAHAGMVPTKGESDESVKSFPRTRGDGPIVRWIRNLDAEFPPHTRGWSLHGAIRPRNQCVSPAHAGMVPKCAAETGGALSFPRTRGDGPA